MLLIICYTFANTFAYFPHYTPHVSSVMCIPPFTIYTTYPFTLSFIVVRDLTPYLSKRKRKRKSACKVDPSFCIIVAVAGVTVGLACKTYISICSRYFHVHFLHQKKVPKWLSRLSIYTYLQYKCLKKKKTETTLK